MTWKVVEVCDGVFLRLDIEDFSGYSAQVRVSFDQSAVSLLWSPNGQSVKVHI